MRPQSFKRNAPAGRFCIYVMLLSCAAFAGCRRSERTITQTAAPSSQAVSPAPPVSPSPLTTTTPPGQPSAPPPQPSEVRQALARVYQNALTPDESRDALTADFNGDGSEDIAVVVKPNAAQLSDINSEYANWIVEDPQRVLPPQEIRPGQPTPTPPAPVKVEAGDTLLAIIHGYESAGWRNADAKQTYLLKNAVGDEMRAQSAEEARRTNTERRPLPFLRGDLIWQKLSGKTGCIFWTGAKYGWHGPARTSAQAKSTNSPPRPAQ